MEIEPDETSVNEIVQLLCNAHFRFRRFKEAHALAKFLAYGCPNPRLAEMGITEIFINAIEHGNLGISAEEKSQLQKQNKWLKEINRRLELPTHRHQYVNVAYMRTQSEITLKIIDDGEGFNWQAHKNLNQHAEKLTNGRGILMAAQLAFKSLCYAGKGNEVNCVISLES